MKDEKKMGRTINLGDAAWRLINKKATEKGMSASGYARMLILQGLKKHE